MAEEAEASLTNQGLALDTFQLQDVQAEGNYLADLGRPEAARVQMEADIAEARAQQSSAQERLLANEAIAVAERRLELKKAEIRAETDAAEANAAAAGPMAAAAQDQMVLAEQEKVAARTAALRTGSPTPRSASPPMPSATALEQEAESAKNAAIASAEAARQATIAAAQARAEQDRLVGEGQRAQRAALAEATEIEGRLRGSAERQQREAIAAAVEQEGKAEAAAILARGEAEAEAMDRKAAAFREYGDAAIVDLLARVLPEVVRAAAEPISAVDKLTVISTDGASQLTRNVAGNVEQGLQLASDLTGVDLREMLAGFASRRTAATAPPAG